MSTQNDRLGLVSFANDVTSDAALQSPFGPVITQINTLNSRTAMGTDLRQALKKAIDNLRARPNGNSNAVRAVITLTDGNGIITVRR